MTAAEKLQDEASRAVREAKQFLEEVRKNQSQSPTQSAVTGGQKS